MNIKEVLENINKYKPNKINIDYLKKSFYSIQLNINNFFIDINFDEKSQKSSCYITFMGNYFFSTEQEIKIVLEYLYLVLNKDVSNNICFV